MVSALILFGIPDDPAAFDEHFAKVYHPLLLRVPRLEELRVHRVAGAAKGKAPFRVVVEVRFASEEAMRAGLNSEEGQAVARNVGRFASGGVTVLFCQTSRMEDR